MENENILFLSEILGENHFKALADFFLLRMVVRILYIDLLYYIDMYYNYLRRCMPLWILGREV